MTAIDSIRAWHVPVLGQGPAASFSTQTANNYRTKIREPYHAR